MNFFNWLINEFLGNVFNNVRLFIDWLARPFTDPWKTLKNLWRPKVPSKLRNFFLFVLLVLVFVGLGWLTYLLGWHTIPNRGWWFFRYTWMGWVAFLVYVIIRLGVAILRQLRVLSPAYAAFRDIDEAIHMGVVTAERAGIAVDQVPLILVFGLSQEAEQEFAKSPSLGRDVRYTDADAPVHWYGDERALWITLPGVSATSIQADFLREAENQGVSALPVSLESGVPGSEGDELGKTISVGSFLQGGAGAAVAAPPLRSPQQTVDVAAVGAKQRKVARDRMRYFSQALHRLRYPVCTVNAAILCVPFCEHVVPDKTAQQFRDCVGTDMKALQDGLGVRCMSMVLFAGCNDNPAFRAYIERLPPQTTVHRCGVSFPQLVNLDDEDPERLHSWLLRDFELQAMQLYKSSAGEPVNEDIFRFVDLIRRGRSYFTNILGSAFLHSPEPAFSFAGVYFSELTAVNNVSHPFLNGVLGKVLHEHDEVISWTTETLEQDARQKRTSRLLLVLAVGLMALDVWLIWTYLLAPN